MDFNFERIITKGSIERDFKILRGILEGIKADSIVNSKELELLKSWASQLKDYRNRQPYFDLVFLIEEIANSGMASTQDIEDILWFIDSKNNYINMYNLDSKSNQELLGILTGITSDNIINKEEVNFVKKWLEDNNNLIGTFPYDEISFAFTKFDTTQIRDYLDDLLKICNEFSGGQYPQNNDGIMEFLSENISNEIIEFDGSKFCITGKSSQYSRNELSNIILERGGQIVGISKILDYLVICKEKSAAWTYGIYGKKIDQIIKYNKMGVKIKIITEDHLLKA